MTLTVAGETICFVVGNRGLSSGLSLGEILVKRGQTNVYYDAMRISPFWNHDMPSWSLGNSWHSFLEDRLIFRRVIVEKFLFQKVSIVNGIFFQMTHKSKEIHLYLAVFYSISIISQLFYSKSHYFEVSKWSLGITMSLNNNLLE